MEAGILQRGNYVREAVEDHSMRGCDGSEKCCQKVL
jgi:hypothetical protein